MNLKQILGSLVLICCIGISSCKTGANNSEEQHFIKTVYFDSSVDPADNFFLYVNGGWLDTATIGKTDSRIGAFVELRDSNRAHLKLILETAAASDAAKGTIQQKVGDFYTSGMDTTAINALGYAPVKPTLQKIEQIKTEEDIARFTADQYSQLNRLLYIGFVAADPKNSDINILQFHQGGLGLPDRDYYFKDDPATKKIVAAYKDYIAKLFQLTGVDAQAARQKAENIYALEKKMATAHKTQVELRDPNANYHKMAVIDFDKKVPHLYIAEGLKQLGIDTDTINVSQPEYFDKLNTLIASEPMDLWKDYLTFHTLDHYAPLLSSDFEIAHFAYHDKALSGQQEMKPRWERITGLTNRVLGEALGQLYVEKYFDEAAKQRMQELVDNLEESFSKHIDAVEWMSDSTKLAAQSKLRSFVRKIGYPEKWRDYSKVNITEDDFFGNVAAAEKNEFEFYMNKIDQPVDKTEWHMTPPTVNAYYNPSANEIVFPAGILQYPFFDPQADDAINYGGIGMVIGHEMTHGFDDQGAQFDKDGNLKMWWTKEDYANFQGKANKVIEQYNSFTVLDSLHIKGALTNGENIADLGGISIAYDAFQRTEQAQDSTKINGFTPDQRFFISFAQIWRSKYKDEALRHQVNTNHHSPPVWRVNGPLMNFTPFYKTFDVQPGDGMYKPDSLRIKIW